MDPLKIKDTIKTVGVNRLRVKIKTTCARTETPKERMI